MLLPQISIRGQELIAQSKILIVGLGGLGCPAALYLAGAGFHTVGLIDGDRVELSNLHRQVLHSEDRVAWPKVLSAKQGLSELNSNVNYRTYHERLSATNALDILAEYDTVLDCTDNPATRYLINDACVLLGIRLVSGAAQRTEGQLMVLNYPVSKGPCYRCVFPKPPAPETVVGCSEIGILGSVVGMIGILMAGEALKLAVATDGERDGFTPSMLLYNGWSKDAAGTFRTVKLRRQRKECVVCDLGYDGEDRITREKLRDNSMDYQAFCGTREDVKILGPEQRVTAADFAGLMTSTKEEEDDAATSPIVVDTREEHEVAMGSKIRGALNIPFSRILRERPDGTPASSAEEDSVWTDVLLKAPGPVYFVCQRGNDSQIAATRLRDRRGLTRGPEGQYWIGDVEGGFEALERRERDR